MKIEHVLVPVRDPHEVGRSRVGSGLKWGGHGIQENSDQAERAVGSIVHCCLKHHLDFTLLPFPDYVKCPVYLKDAFRRIDSLSHIPMAELCDQFWPLTNEHGVIANAAAIRSSYLPNQGQASPDS